MSEGLRVVLLPGSAVTEKVTSWRASLSYNRLAQCSLPFFLTRIQKISTSGRGLTMYSARGFSLRFFLWSVMYLSYFLRGSSASSENATSRLPLTMSAISSSHMSGVQVTVTD